MDKLKYSLIGLSAFIIIYVALTVKPLIQYYSNTDRSNNVEINGKKYYIEDLKDYSPYKKARKDFISNLNNVFQNFAMEEILNLEAKEKNITVDELLSRTKREHSYQEISAVYEDYKDRLQGMSLQDATPRIIDFLNSMAEQEFKRNLFQKYPVVYNFEKPDKINILPKNNPSIGSKDAKVTIIEFSDFECPYCQRSQSVNKQLREKYKDRIRWVFRDFPLNFHQNAMFAHIAANCAEKQGKYWEMFDNLFQNTGSLEKSKVLKIAEQLNLDMSKFQECTTDKSISDEIRNDISEGQEVGVSGTPAFFINGIMVEGAQPISAFENIIDQELK